MVPAATTGTIYDFFWRNLPDGTATVYAVDTDNRGASTRFSFTRTITVVEAREPTAGRWDHGY